MVWIFSSVHMPAAAFKSKSETGQKVLRSTATDRPSSKPDADAKK